MKKFLTFVLVTGYSLLVTFSAHASVSTPTRDYLRSVVQTDWITMARVASGDVNLTTDHLHASPGGDATDYERRILAIVAAGENPASFAGTNWVARLGDFFDGNQIGAAGLLNDDAWGILAFRAAGISSDDRRVTSPRDVLLQNQNSDGGWGFARNATSDTNDTAVVLQALLEAGLSGNDGRLVRGFNYLKQAQRNDGGVGFTLNNDPDTASTAWAMTAFNKAGYTGEANRAGSWLENQRRGDGSYRWRVQDNEGTPLMTAYAAIALAPASFPVRSLGTVLPPSHPPSASRVTVEYRIEGRDTTLCQGSAFANNPLDLLDQVASRCGLSMEIVNSSFGRYVRGINGQTASGETGWLYRVNYQKPEVGAADYTLRSGDAVLWYFGRFDIQPLRIITDRTTIRHNESVGVSVQMYSDANRRWESVPANQVTLQIAGRSLTVDEISETISNVPSGTWTITAYGDRFVRAVPVSITVTIQAAEQATPSPTNTPPSIPLDSDMDGLSDSEEQRLGTNPRLADTDGDGYMDLLEVRNGYDPRSWVPCKVRSAGHTSAQRRAIDQCWAAYTERATPPAPERRVVPAAPPVVRVVPTTKPTNGGSVRLRVSKPKPAVTKPVKIIIKKK